MVNNCVTQNKIPTIRGKSKIIAILKPGKNSATPKNYRPISLLCHTYKLYERFILNRIAPTIEEHLIKEQAGFRPGKSCTSQLLNLTQHIEDGYQVGKITRTALVDLYAAYDTVTHRRLIQKLYNTTQDSKLCRVIQNLMSNRRVYLELNKERSRWRKQKKIVYSHQPYSTFTPTTSRSTMEPGSKYLGLLVVELSGGTQSPANRDQLLS